MSIKQEISDLGELIVKGAKLLKRITKKAEKKPKKVVNPHARLTNEWAHISGSNLHSSCGGVGWQNNAEEGTKNIKVYIYDGDQKAKTKDKNITKQAGN